MQSTAEKSSATARGERSERGPDRESDITRRRFGHAIGVAVNAVLLVLASSPLVWRIPFLTESFVAPLALIRISLLASMLAELSLIYYDEDWFQRAVHVGLGVIAFVATYSLLTVFPFEFPTAVLDDVMRLALIVALVGIVIGTIVRFFQLLFAWLKR